MKHLSPFSVRRKKSTSEKDNTKHKRRSLPASVPLLPQTSSMTNNGRTVKKHSEKKHLDNYHYRKKPLGQNWTKATS